MVLPFVLPVACYFLYQPINESWTVRQFGCGCPSLDGTRHFNANDFNAILWFLIAACCGIWWARLVKAVFPEKVRPRACALGGFAILLLAAKLWAKTVWL
jgi:hypothetical protein